MKLKVLYLSFLFLVSLGLSAQDIAEIDANFRVATVGNHSVHYYDALSAPFEVTGFPWWKSGEELHRLPSEFTTKEVSDFMLVMAKCTSGGAIRFQTDSPFLAVKATYGRFSDMSHIPRSGTAGFDLFVDAPKDGSTLCGTVFPGPKAGEEGVEICLDGLREGELLTYTLYLPLYSSLTSLEIGFKPGSRLLPPPPQKMSKAICFYGSSITQGACASRPANNYTTMLCRAFDAPQVNLGFSGVAQGEPAVARAIGELKLSAFVYDYDYNAPTPEHLAKTHESFFQIIRAAQPELPIIILSRCTRPNPQRRDIIRRTYENAVAAGDKKVWFIDGAELFGEPGQDFCRVDAYHPNDLGFYMMYLRILPVLKEALNMN